MIKYTIVLTLLCVVGCSSKVLHCNYVASQERKEQIVSNWQKIKTGMTSNQVKQVLGKPDEITPIYRYIWAKNQKSVGNNYWYILERRDFQGSGWNKESLVRIGFDNTDKATGIDRWGF